VIDVIFKSKQYMIQIFAKIYLCTIHFIYEIYILCLLCACVL